MYYRYCAFVTVLVVSIRNTAVCEYVRYLNLDVPAYLYGTAWYRTTAVHVQAVLLNLAALVLVLKVKWPLY